MLKDLRNLYHGRSKRAQRFRYALLGFDLATIVFVIVTSFLPAAPWVLVADVAIGAVVGRIVSGEIDIRSIANAFSGRSTS